MSHLKRLIAEIHRRSLWQVLGIYLAGAWVALQVVREVTLTLHLPDWVPPLAFVLLVIGLPIVLATAFVQEGGPLGEERAGPEPDEGARGAGERPSGAPGRARRSEGGVLEDLFTWKNALAGGVLAFALLGLAVTGWFLVRTELGSRALLETANSDPPAAAVGEDAGAAAAGDGEAEGPEADGVPGETASAEEARPETEPPARFAAPDPDTTSPDATTGDGIRERRPAADPAAEGARSRFREARDATEEALRSAVEAGARLVGEDLLATGDSLSAAAVADADAGRHAESAATMERARRAYREAGDAARDVWLARLDSVKDEVRSLLGRRELDSTAEAYARAEELHRQATELENFGRYPEAVRYLRRTVAAYERVPTAGEDSLPAAYELSPREVVDATVEKIARAIEAEDLAALREVWTSLSDEQAVGFREFFGQVRDLSVEYSVREGSIVVGEDRVIASVETVWRYYDEADRSRREQRDDHRFEFTLRNGVWVVTGS